MKSGLKAYEGGKGDPSQTKEMKKNRVYHSMEKQDETYIKYLQGKDVCRYKLNWSGEYLKYGNNLAAPRGINLFNFRIFGFPTIRKFLPNFRKCETRTKSVCVDLKSSSV